MIKINDNLTVYYPLELVPRSQQIDALNFCKETINNGKKFMLLNMPTGSGKSYFVTMFANWYKNFVNKNAKIDILTNSKILQDQYIKDFPFISNLKGRKNYWCEHHKTDCSEGKELNKVLKRICYECPYDNAKLRWKQSEIAITNFALFLSLSLFTPTIQEKDSNVLIIDEAHDFESIFCDYISIKLNPRILKKCGFKQDIIVRYVRKFKKIRTSENFINFIKNEFSSDVWRLYEHYTEKLKNEIEKSVKNMYIKYISYNLSLSEKLDNLIKSYEDDPNNWALDISYNNKKEIDLNIQPVWGYPYLKKVIWDNYDHVIFMSGTILDKNMYSFINGLDTELVRYQEMDSDFDLKKRPLYYIKVGKMTYKEREKTFEKQIEIINKILKKYKKDKGIIHTVNYEIADWVKNNIQSTRLIFHNGENRDEMYDKFIKAKTPKIMVSPSMMSGVDLKDDLSRFAIILKIPYPNISSNKIKARQRTNRDWYEWKTVVDLIQAYGRTIRSTDDYSDSFILDSSLSDIMKYKSKYLPRYFTNAIKILS
jgi:ATP-dependent DNA helicase DinG